MYESTKRLVLARDQLREVDRRAIEEFGLAGIVLMENAGARCAELLRSLGPPRHVVICAGGGNNGGDGFVVARHLESWGVSVCVLLFADPRKLSSDASTNYTVCRKGETRLRIFEAAPVPRELDREFDEADWIVDALLGTGIRGSVRTPYPTIIDAVNRATARVFSIDLPSGLECDTGEFAGACVQADHTATLVARKPGFSRAEAEKMIGQVHVVDIGLPRRMLDELSLPPGTGAD